MILFEYGMDRLIAKNLVNALRGFGYQAEARQAPTLSGERVWKLHISKAPDWLGSLITGAVRKNRQEAAALIAVSIKQVRLIGMEDAALDALWRIGGHTAVCAMLPSSSQAKVVASLMGRAKQPAVDGDWDFTNDPFAILHSRTALTKTPSRLSARLRSQVSTRRQITCTARPTSSRS